MLFKSLIKKNKNKKTKKKSIIFCSTENDRDRILKGIGITDKKIFYIGDRIHILDIDLIGIINSARIKVNEELDKKEKIDLNTQKYQLMIEDQHINTDSYNIHRADISIFSKYAGIPFENVIFIISKSTVLTDLKSAIKYALKSIQFLFFPDSHNTFVDISETRKDYFSTGLQLKIKLIK